MTSTARTWVEPTQIVCLFLLVDYAGGERLEREDLEIYDGVVHLRAAVVA